MSILEVMPYAQHRDHVRMQRITQYVTADDQVAERVRIGCSIDGTAHAWKLAQCLNAIDEF